MTSARDVIPPCSPYPHQIDPGTTHKALLGAIPHTRWRGVGLVQWKSLARAESPEPIPVMPRGSPHDPRTPTTVAPDAGEREREDGDKGGAHAGAVVPPAPPPPRGNSGCRGSRHIKWTWHAPGEQARARRTTLRVTKTAGSGVGVGIARDHPLRLRLRLLVSSRSRGSRHRYRLRLCSLRSVRGAHAYRIRLRFRALICASCGRSVRARSLLCATPSAFLFGMGRGSWPLRRAGSG